MYHYVYKCLYLLQEILKTLVNVYIMITDNTPLNPYLHWCFCYWQAFKVHNKIYLFISPCIYLYTSQHTMMNSIYGSISLVWWIHGWHVTYIELCGVLLHACNPSEMDTTSLITSDLLHLRVLLGIWYRWQTKEFSYFVELYNATLSELLWYWTLWICLIFYNVSPSVTGGETR